MSIAIVIAFVVFFCFRLFTLIISIRNEKRLKQAGAQEYGKLNSIILAILHVMFYFSAFAEGYINHVQFDKITIISVVIYALSMMALFYVIRQLSPI